MRRHGRKEERGRRKGGRKEKRKVVVCACKEKARSSNARKMEVCARLRTTCTSTTSPPETSHEIKSGWGLGMRLT